MRTFIMLIGLPASGKSTYAQELSNLGSDTIVVSTDKIREDLFSNVNEQLKNNIVFKEAKKRICKAFHKENIKVIFDATNINYKRRMEMLNYVKSNCVGYIDCRCLLMATPYEQCIENNLHRKRKVPEDVIKRMYINFNIPQYYEGWDLIQIKYDKDYKEYEYDYRNDDIVNAYKNYMLSKVLEKIKIPHDNPHHTYDVFEHCRRCREIVIKDTGGDNFLSYVAGLHDIGKPFTKSFFNTKGEKTDIAHYYNHNFVGAYDLLFVNYNHEVSDGIIYECGLVMWHMRPFQLEQEESKKAKERFINLIGDDFYKDLMILHKADIESA